MIKQEFQAFVLVNRTKEYIECKLSECRHLVCSFEHSEELQKQLKDLQKTHKLEYKTKLIQDCETRWNIILMT